jgi:hypothetical protein
MLFLSIFQTPAFVAFDEQGKSTMGEVRPTAHVVGNVSRFGVFVVSKRQ